MQHAVNRGSTVFAKNHALLHVCGDVAVVSAYPLEHAVVDIDATALEIESDGNCDVAEEVVSDQQSSRVHDVLHVAVCIQSSSDERNEGPGLCGISWFPPFSRHVGAHVAGRTWMRLSRGCGGRGGARVA